MASWVDILKSAIDLVVDDIQHLYSVCLSKSVENKSCRTLLKDLTHEVPATFKQLTDDKASLNEDNLTLTQQLSDIREKLTASETERLALSEANQEYERQFANAKVFLENLGLYLNDHLTLGDSNLKLEADVYTQWLPAVTLKIQQLFLQTIKPKKRQEVNDALLNTLLNKKSKPKRLNTATRLAKKN